MIPLSPLTQIAIAARDVSRRFGRRWALVNVSFEVPRGSVMMLAGQNGSGKTTLLRVLATLLRPNGGSASVAGFDVVGERESLRPRIALLSHHSYLYESLTARENLELVLSVAGRSRAGADAVLDRVGLLPRAGDLVGTFSAGMRKRLSFARVLLLEREIVFLDEPYGNLDAPGFALVDEVLGELKRRGTTLIVATHQVEHVASYTDQRMTLDNGRVSA